MAEQTLQIVVSQEKVRHLLQEHAEGLLLESPEWQRQGGIWDTQTKSRLVESLLLGLPVPPLFMLSTGKKREIVDGLQRFTTLRGFLGNKFALTGLEFLDSTAEKDLNGCFFKDLKQEQQDVLHHAVLSAYTVPTSNRWGRDVARIMFRRLNSGVTVSNPEKIIGTHDVSLAREIADYLYQTLWASDRYRDRRKTKKKRGGDIEDALIVLLGLRLKMASDDIFLDDYGYKDGGSNQWGHLVEQSAGQINKMTTLEKATLRTQAQEVIHLIHETFSEPFSRFDSDKSTYSPRVNKMATLVQVWGFAQSGKLPSYWASRTKVVEEAWKTFCTTAGPMVPERQSLRRLMQGWKDSLAALP